MLVCVRARVRAVCVRQASARACVLMEGPARALPRENGQIFVVASEGSNLCCRIKTVKSSVSRLSGRSSFVSRQNGQIFVFSTKWSNPRRRVKAVKYYSLSRLNGQISERVARACPGKCLSSEETAARKTARHHQKQRILNKRIEEETRFHSLSLVRG